MVKLFIGLGALIFVAGAIAVGLALPYVVLERGFTQVIVGTVGMNAGLVLIGIGAVLREIRKGRLPGTAATSAAAISAAALDAPQVEAGSVAPHAIAVGAAVTGMTVATNTSIEAATDKLSQPEFEWPKLDASASGPEPELNLPRFELPPLDFPRIILSDANGTHLVDTTGAEQDMPGHDEFTRLRAALSDQLERPDSRDDGSAQADLEQAGVALDVNGEDNERSPAQADVAAEGEDVTFGSEPDDTDRPEVEAFEPPRDMPEPESPEPEAPEPEAPQITREVVSDEGVMRAYQVGDTAFTVYGDGTIRAETRDGQYTFQSMEEVRAFLAQEKLKARS